jgi:hypothetical protein
LVTVDGGAFRDVGGAAGVMPPGPRVSARYGAVSASVLVGGGAVIP